MWPLHCVARRATTRAHLQSVDRKLVHAAGREVFGLLVRAIPNVGHGDLHGRKAGWGAALSPPPHCPALRLPRPRPYRRARTMPLATARAHAAATGCGPHPALLRARRASGVSVCGWVVWGWNLCRRPWAARDGWLRTSPLNLQRTTDSMPRGFLQLSCARATVAGGPLSTPRLPICASQPCRAQARGREPHRHAHEAVALVALELVGLLLHHHLAAAPAGLLRLVFHTHLGNRLQAQRRGARGGG